MTLRELDSSLFVVDHPLVVGGLHLGTRTTVMRISPRELLVHAPGPLDAEDVKQIDRLGAVSVLVAPNNLHHMFLPAAKLFASALYDIDLGDLVPEDAVQQLAYPVLVIHGEADSRIPVSHGRRVRERAPQGSELWTLPGVDHVDAFLDQPEEYVARVLAYFSTRLDGLE